MPVDVDGAYSKYRQPLIRYLRKRVRPDDVDDLLQETFERYFRERSTGGRIPDAAELPWLYRVARNLTLDYYRRNRAAAENLENPGDVADRLQAPEAGVFADQVKAVMFAAVADMHPDGRYVRLLVLLLDGTQTQAEIGNELGYSLRTIRRMSTKVLSKLAEVFKESGITPEFLAE